MAIINLNDATPAAPSGRTNCIWQADASAPRNVSVYVPLLVGDSGSGGTSGAVPAPAAGDAAAGKFLKADGTFAVPSGGPIVIGFIINSGITGTNVGPMLAAPRAGSLSSCVVTVKASDASTPLTFTIKKNGTSIFTSDPTVLAGTGSGTVVIFTSLIASPPLSVAANDVFSIDISSGSSSWQFAAQLES